MMGLEDGAATHAVHACALVIVDELDRQGVRDLVLAPGSRSTPVAVAAVAHERLRVHVQIDERSAAFLALGIGAESGRAVAVLTTSGSAVANLHPAAVEADAADVPLLLVTADRPPELRGTGANQTIDQTKLFGDTVRWFVDLGVPEDRSGQPAHWRSTVSRAVATARGRIGRPGPVHLNLPFPEPLVPTPGTCYGQPLAAPPGPYTRVHRRRVRPDDATLEELRSIIATVEQGMVVVGTCKDHEGAAAAAFGARLGWPVVAEGHGHARRGPAAVPTAVLQDEAFVAANQPDLVVRVGRVGLSRPMTRFLRQVGTHGVQVLVDPHGRWHDPTRGIDRIVVGDVEDVLHDLLPPEAEQVESDTVDGWLGRWQTAGRAAADAISEALDEAEAAGELTEPGVVRAVLAELDGPARLVVASSMPIRDLDLVLPVDHPVWVRANRGASGIDGIVSTALGVAFAADRDETGPGRTHAIVGDLSFLHDTNAWLARFDGAAPDLTLVVLDNDGGGIFHFLEQADEPAFERVFGTPHGTDLPGLAGAHGVPCTTVTTPEELVGALRDARAVRGPVIVHVRTDRARNRELHRALTSAVVARTSSVG